MMPSAKTDLRRERSRRLEETDWVELAAEATNSRRLAELRAQRQALRDLPDTVEDPVTFSSWPVASFLSDRLPFDLVLRFALEAITIQTGRVQTLYVTPTPFQSLIYDRKDTEAQDFLAGGSGPWPILSADVGTSSGPDLAAVAATVLERAAAWRAIAAALEGLRRQAIDEVTAATDRNEIVAALDRFDERLVATGLTPEPL